MFYIFFRYYIFVLLYDHFLFLFNNYYVRKLFSIITHIFNNIELTDDLVLNLIGYQISLLSIFYGLFPVIISLLNDKKYLGISIYKMYILNEDNSKFFKNFPIYCLKIIFYFSLIFISLFFYIIFNNNCSHILILVSFLLLTFLIVYDTISYILLYSNDRIIKRIESYLKKIINDKDSFLKKISELDIKTSDCSCDILEFIILNSFDADLSFNIISYYNEINNVNMEHFLSYYKIISRYKEKCINVIDYDEFSNFLCNYLNYKNKNEFIDIIDVFLLDYNKKIINSKYNFSYSSYSSVIAFDIIFLKINDSNLDYKFKVDIFNILWCHIILLIDSGYNFVKYDVIFHFIVLVIKSKNIEFFKDISKQIGSNKNKILFYTILNYLYYLIEVESVDYVSSINKNIYENMCSILKESNLSNDMNFSNFDDFIKFNEYVLTKNEIYEHKSAFCRKKSLIDDYLIFLKQFYIIYNLLNSNNPIEEELCNFNLSSCDTEKIKKFAQFISYNIDMSKLNIIFKKINYK